MLGTLMVRYRSLTAVGVSLATLAGLAACAPPDEETATGGAAEAIVGGTPASELPEAAFIDASGFLCSGAVIAPRVVLTAGHCVPDASSWNVTVPFANKQQARARKAWTEYRDLGDSVNPNSNDVALLILDTPITLASYPALAKSPVPNGTKAVNVGRIKNDNVSATALFKGAPVRLERGNPSGFPFSYVSDEVIEDGDSGGPVYVGAGSSRMIVAVNSGGGGGTQLLARVDLAYAKIQQVIAENGGAGGGGGGEGDGGSSSDGSSSGGSSTDCWSKTLGRTVPELTCVESKFDGGWSQCKEGDWYRGGDAQEGKFGTCLSSFALP